MVTPARVRSAARPRGATIRDVAARAGVSVATVSRVFNAAEVVTDQTARRVREAAHALRYAPHVAARSLSTRRTGTIGVLLPDLHGEFFSEVIRGIDGAARRSGYHLLVSGSHSDWNEMAAVLAATRGRVDGIIVMSPDLCADELHAHLPSGLPAVLLNCPTASGPSITIDNIGGSTAAVRHLAALGHRRIAFIRGPERNADAQERLRGYRTAISGLGKRDPDLELPGDFTEDGGYAAALNVLMLRPLPTAIFAANDATAIGAMCALREAGLNVPGDIAMAGFDDIPVAGYVAPPLTTVGVDIAGFGARSLELLLEVLTRGSERREILPTKLVVRESCGASLSGASRQNIALSTERQPIQRRSAR